MTSPDEFDPAKGRSLVFEYEQAMAYYRNATRYTPPPSDAALRAWLWQHRQALVDAALNLPGAYLQVEARDRTIQELLRTLSETEARLPGITRAP